VICGPRGSVSPGARTGASIPRPRSPGALAGLLEEWGSSRKKRKINANHSQSNFEAALTISRRLLYLWDIAFLPCEDFNI
jgi:hypothetical protein